MCPLGDGRGTREQQKHAKSLGPCSRLAHWHFCLMLLAKRGHIVKLGVRGMEIHLPPFVERMTKLYCKDSRYGKEGRIGATIAISCPLHLCSPQREQ